MTSPAAQRTLHFQFERDTFAFANELVWEYRFEPGTGAVTTFRNNPPPGYSHRCFVMVRSVRQSGGNTLCRAVLGLRPERAAASGGDCGLTRTAG